MFFISLQNTAHGKNHYTTQKIPIIIVLLSLSFSIAAKNTNDFNIYFCEDQKNCTALSSFVSQREVIFTHLPNRQKHYIEFKHTPSFSELESFFYEKKLSKLEKRRFLQILMRHINQFDLLHFQAFMPPHKILLISPIIINNAALITFEEHNSQEIITLLTQYSQQENKYRKKNIKRKYIYLSDLVVEGQPDYPTIGLIDSGVSNQHEQLKSVDITQYNPLENNFKVIDTGLGHGTGILSLLAASGVKGQQKGLLREAKYLSCNGLPGGKYDFITTLQCFDWILKQPFVDILLNAWLVSSPGCRHEWLLPLRALWHSGTFPIFAVGNYGLSQNTNYSPANLNPFSEDVPLMTIGALDEQLQRLPTSSFGTTSCSKKRTLPTIMAIGNELTVAVPFTPQSYLRVNGTSYAIAFVGADLIQLMQRFPQLALSDITRAVLASTDDLGKQGVDKEYGYGKINISAAIKVIEKRFLHQ